MPPSILGKLPHDVLIFHGRQDRIVPLDTSLYLLEHLQHAELYVLDRSGHWSQLERWDIMRPMIERHFGARDWTTDRKSTRLTSSPYCASRMPSFAGNKKKKLKQ